MYPGLNGHSLGPVFSMHEVCNHKDTFISTCNFYSQQQRAAALRKRNKTLRAPLACDTLSEMQTRITRGGHESVALRNVNKNIAADACTHWCALHDVPDDARTGREGAALPAILWQHPANWSHQAS